MKKLKILILAIVTILVSIIMISKPQEVYAAGVPEYLRDDEYEFGNYVLKHMQEFVKMDPTLSIGIEFKGTTEKRSVTLENINCIDSLTYTTARKCEAYQILNIIDIGRTSPMSVDVYKTTGKEGKFKKYTATDTTSKKAGARMAYYASRKTNDIAQEIGITGTYSQIYQKHKDWFWGSLNHHEVNDTTSGRKMNDDAIAYQKSVEDGYTKITKVSQDSDIAITPKTDKKGKVKYTVIGPFKATFKGGTIGSPTLVLYDGSGNVISTTTGNVVNSTGKKSATIKSNKNFYIKYSGALPSNYARLSLSLQHKSPLMYRAVVCLISNRKSKMNVGQNLALYGAYSTRKKKTITWGTAPNDNHLKIQKVGKAGEAEEPVKEVGFKLIYNGGYVTTPFNWTDYVTDPNDGSIIFKTLTDGCISLTGIPEGTYQAEEIYVYDRDSGYSAQAQASNRYTGTVEITGEQDEDDTDVLTLSHVNYQYTNLRVHKVVKGSNPEKTIDGVTFKIIANSKETNYQDMWVKSYTFGQPSTFEYTNDENEAASYTTVGGNIDFANIPVGTYKAKEISIPADLPYGKDPSWPNNISPAKYCAPKNDSNYSSYNNLTITCENPWFIKIAGYVYSPEKSGKDEQSVKAREGTTDYKSSDYKVSNAKVTLYKGGSPYKFNTEMGESNCEVTDDNGYYEYTIQISNESDVNDLAVQFTYDGLDFVAVSPNYIDKAYPDEHLKDGSTSKAKEDAAAREKLNQGYSEIKGVKEPENPEISDKGYAVQSSDSSEKELTYKFDKNEGSGEQTTGTSKSTLTTMNTGMQDDKEKKIRKINSGEIKNKITAVYALNGQTTPDNKYNYTNYDLRTDSNSTNPDVLKKVIQLNLGIIRRDQPNLEVSNQIYNVKATINGFENTYQTVGTLKKSENQLNVGVTYVNEGQLADFPVYASDVKTIEENKNNKLEMYITYKVKLTNLSQTLYSKVNEMAIFSDPNYELVSVKDKSGNDITHSDTSKSRTAGLTEIRGEEKLEYNVQYADVTGLNPKPLDDSAKDENNTPSENYDEFYITYKISDDELVKMITADGTSTKYIPQFKNIVEINSYSTYEDSGRTKLYAGIDVDSAPGNVAKEIDTTSLEKDMSEMSYEERDQYKLEKRKGMTSMFDNDTGYAEEFTIHIKGKRTIEGTVFLDNSISSGTGKERTSNGLLEDDENKLKGVQVYLREIDSNEEDKTANIVVNEDGEIVQKENGMQEELSATTDENGHYKFEGFVPGYYVIVYTYDDQTYYMDAQGNAININALDYKSAVITDNNKNYHGGDYFANGELKWYLKDNPSETDKNSDSSSFDKYTEAVDNWTKRQKLDYSKINYNSVKTDSEGNVTSSGTMDAYTPAFMINVELNTLSQENKFVPEGYNINNMDFGITERAVQDIEVTKRVSNTKIMLANGQVLLDGDPSNPDIKMSGLKYIAPSAANKNGTVNIELDSELIHGSTLELTYEIKVNNIGEKDYYNEEYYKYGTSHENEVVISPQIYDYVDTALTFDKEVNPDWDKVDITKFTDDTTSTDKLIVEYNAYNEVKKHNDIVHYNKDIVLPAGTENNLTLILSRVLSNSNDPLSYDNDVEMVEGQKNKGRRIKKTKRTGTQLTPEGTAITTTPIGGSSETTTITPPTGENRDYLIYIITGIGTLLILAAGIIIIKKKVIK